MILTKEQMIDGLKDYTSITKQLKNHSKVIS